MWYTIYVPTKNVVKTYDAPAFYHVYNRASGERLLFRDDDDRRLFMNLLQKHLSECADPDNESVKVYDVSVVTYCLMGTHFHLLLYQQDDVDAISGYMRSVGTAYAMYYNRKYKSKGHVFQSSFRASHINNESYLTHITRYIHLNPRYYHSWKWSSYLNYVGKRTDSWVHPELVLENAEIGDAYAKATASYASIDSRKRNAEIKDYVDF